MRVSSTMPTPLSSAHVQVTNDSGSGGIVLVCEHASKDIPAQFKNLGLRGEALTSHVAWDIGAYEVAKSLSQLLDAPLVAPGVSRLVYDCNRPTSAESAIPARSELYDIPGNIALSEAERQSRSDIYYRPYREALENVLDAAERENRVQAIVTVHSFTPVFNHVKRDVEIGLLHDKDDVLAQALFTQMQTDGAYRAEFNAPYGPIDGVTYTLVEHALPRNLLNVMIEIRNDLIADPANQQVMAERLADYLRAAMADLKQPSQEVSL